MKHLQVFEKFSRFFKRLTDEQWWYYRNNCDSSNPELITMDLKMILNLRSKLPNDWKPKYARSLQIKNGVEFFTAEFELITEVGPSKTNHINKKFSILKSKIELDTDPFYLLNYRYENWNINKDVVGIDPEGRTYYETELDAKHYFRFEEFEFQQICNNPQILIDFLDKL